MEDTAASIEEPTTSTAAYARARSRLLLWGGLMAAIYGFYLFVFPLVPAINRSGTLLDIELLLRNGRAWIALPYTLGLLVLFFAFWRIIRLVHNLSQEEPQAAKRLRPWLLGIGIGCGVLLIGLYPITAIDVALYVVRARLWTLYGGNPLVALPVHYPHDPYLAVAGEFGTVASPYGPLWELIAQIPMLLGFQDIAGGIVAMKCIALIAYIGMAVLIGWHAVQDSPRFSVSPATALAFFALNPLVLLEVIGNGHNDIVMLALMTLALVLWQRGRWAWASLALTGAVLIKDAGVILLPLFGMAVLAASPNWRTRLLRAAAIAAIFLLAAGLLYRLFGPFSTVFKGALGATFNRAGFAPSYIFRAIAREIDPHNAVWAYLPSKVANVLFVLYYLYLLTQLARGKMTLIQAGFLAYFCEIFLTPAFRIWYPLWLVPFAALNLQPLSYWRTFLFALTAELSILSYYILWRWYLQPWDWGVNGPLKAHWNYWFVMTLLNVPWTFGIPLLLPLWRKVRDKAPFKETAAA